MRKLANSPEHVVFVDQSGGRSSGAQESLSLLLAALPGHIDRSVVLFQHGAYEERLRREGFRVIVHPISQALERATRYGPHIRRSLSSSQDIFGLAHLLRRLKPDVVHTNTVKAHLIGLPAARLVGIPGIMHLRDALTGSGRLALTSIGRYAAARSIAVSKHISQWYGISRTDVIYNPLNLSEYLSCPSQSEARSALNLPQDVPIVGIVGPVHKGKGHDRFLRIFSNLARESTAWGAIIGDARFGDDRLLTELRRFASVMGVAERVKFIPWLDDPKPAYSALDMVFNCSTREPFGRSIAEAAACATPSAIFADCGMAELLNDASAIIVTPYDEFEFSKLVAGALRQPSLLKSMGANARTAVERLSLQRHSREVEKSYGELQRSPKRWPKSKPATL